MYAKINNGLIEKYPYTIGELRKDNPQVSFPFHIAKETLTEYGMLLVEETEAPAVDSTQDVSEGTPVFKDGKWVQTWDVRYKPQEELDAIKDAKAQSVRNLRDAYLKASDWTQGKDIPEAVSTAWAPYRQALRDITKQSGFPLNVVWPEQPKA